MGIKMQNYQMSFQAWGEAYGEVCGCDKVGSSARAGGQPGRGFGR
jgi:hypothetical protein